MSKKEAIQLPPGAAKGEIRDNLEVICFALLIIMFFKTFVGQQFKIPTGSMRNTLMIGDHLLVNKFVFATPQWTWEERLFPMRSVQRGDIVVFRFPLNRDSDYVKRCVALPGDTVEIRNKRFFLNGQQVTGDFEHHILDDALGTNNDGHPTFTSDPVSGPWPLTRDTGPAAKEADPVGPWPFVDPLVLARNRHGSDEQIGGFRDNLGPVAVPEGHLFVMGDNRDNSADSRYWGFLPMDHLRGRPFLVWWSFREGDHDYDSGRVPTGPTDLLKDMGDTVRHFFSRTRWERTGLIVK